MSAFQPFLMERWMSLYEQEVEYNLSESGVHPIRLAELLGDDPAAVDELLSTELNYPHVNGTPELRATIAGLYEGATADNILVTVGAAEANYIATRTLLAPGDEIVIMLPNYMQIWGIAKNHGYRMKTFELREKKGWAPDLAELADAISPQTKLVAICNPNNPTGRALSAGEMEAIIAQAERVGAWILADEVYSGAERTVEEPTPSFYGRYDKVVATGSMSKAYGLPGLRLGWAVAPAGVVHDIWERHEYTTISATMLANKLAAMALSPEVRPRVLARTREYIRQGFPILRQWMAGHADMFSVRPPDAAAIAFVRYNLAINSTELAERLRTEKSVLIVPGDHFGLDHFLRISFGLPHDYLVAGLERIRDLISELS
ncbi:MAG: aminotransferase class I/II-fold pyridoxal phosphate-dependent enzyme [Chloroflexota bacterium]|nr:MAG: aminotransferase class I/II-fold pyridoxal phosphate-dependent enzyme [Chloroflexota bacterium]